MPSATSRRDPSRSSGVPRRLRRERHRPAPGPDRRQHRRDLRQHRRAVRRLLSAPPPDYEVDDAGPRRAAGHGASLGRAGQSGQSGGYGTPGKPGKLGNVGKVGKHGTRRTRIRLAVASIPLVVALVLLAVTLTGGSGDSSGSVDAGEAAGPVPPALAAVQEPAGQPASGDEGGRLVTDGEDAPAEGPAGPPESAPDPPPGHRSVAVRLASPDAGDLVRGGDRVDVVGPDARVLAASLAVLQVRSAAGATVLVVAVPEDEAPRLAAAAAGPGLTAVVVPDQDAVPGGS